MRSITLVGYMCVGKTTVGKELARVMGLKFYDLDWYIEERFHARVAEIFERDGEQRFRDLERRMLHEAAEFEDIVLSCGGGTPCFFDNIDYLNSVSNTVYLRATSDVILEHLRVSRGKRPLLEGKSPDELAEYVTSQIKEREPFYMKARTVVDVPMLCDRQRVVEICNQISKEIKPD